MKNFLFLCQRICSCKVALEILKNACKKVFSLPSMALVESVSCLRKLLNFSVFERRKQTWKAAKQTAARNENEMQEEGSARLLRRNNFVK